MNQAEAIAAAKSLGPEWKWVAMDLDSQWYAYRSEPFVSFDFWRTHSVDGFWRVGLGEGQKWKSSLTKVPQ